MEKESESVWPDKDLEPVECCPMCQSASGEPIYSGVKDWAFECAPGDWIFYNCLNCKSLYLNPRPTRSSISMAYGKYYTHDSNLESNSLTTKLKNEFMFHKFGISSLNRLNLKNKWFVSLVNPFIYRKFPLDDLIILPRGTLLDIGCGNGDFLITAKLMGYSVYGIEIDLQAFTAASKRGLNVWHGSYEILDNINIKFDYIVCSHVVEHVHNPLHFLNMVSKSTKSSSMLMLSWPNPNSIVLKWFKKYWRGLEAPRHLCLPSTGSVINELTKLGFVNFKTKPSPIHTFGDSLATKFRRKSVIIKLANKVIYLITNLIKLNRNQDITEIMCVKK
jgi:2-polyprenyl-3-methyl-5-hydroxy-6-metoxy-1,4-benzoquinol methylase